MEDVLYGLNLEQLQKLTTIFRSDTSTLKDERSKLLIMFKMVNELNNGNEIKKLLIFNNIIDELGIPFLKYAKSLEVRQSNIHGIGVFTTVFIPKNAVITCYPIDFIQFGVNCSGGPKINKMPHDEIKDLFLKYSLNTQDGKYLLTGSIKDINKYKLGHLINDAHIPTLTQNTIDDLIKYTTISTKETNTEFEFLDNIIPVITSKRDVLPNEELTISYGFFHWACILNNQKFKNNSVAIQIILDKITELPNDTRHQTLALLIDIIEKSTKSFSFSAV